jgi:hypothetical protein
MGLDCIKSSQLNWDAPLEHNVYNNVVAKSIMRNCKMLHRSIMFIANVYSKKIMMHNWKNLLFGEIRFYLPLTAKTI